MKTDKEYKLTVESITVKGTVITERQKNKPLPNLSAISGTLEALLKRNGKLL